MKKLISIILVVILLVFSLNACTIIRRTDEEKNPKEESSKTESINNNKVYAEDELDDDIVFTMRDSDDNVLIRNSDIRKVAADYDETNGYCLTITFTAEGKEKFAKATRENIGKHIYIYVDDLVLSSPVVEEEITDGQAVITGGTDYESLMSMYDALT